MQQPSDVAVDGRIRRSKRAYAAWVVLMPGVMFGTAFAALCAWECTAAPWLAFLIVPALALVLWLVSVAIYVRWSYGLSREQGGALRKFIGFSILWAPALAGFSVFVVLSLVIGAFSLTGR